ncbi:MAG: hypothetical protein A3I89_03240 [Candidatus Harrisonbacteria bacterium RIFCSPLOWO2_02_FULL_41_11]|uniref:DUF5667 domain-containing protein n=1 Tax=Candidatus Harrisonbacteria bacterium RIFCSPHIGHO2_02_FULL_42_16 TaxID=1798404 RepID=A0A1G1ZIQ4_9BACT|nr:MAG: hypothetical protein A3B92_02730 [Candidatus Harrisonbacteria bacterium RIFCSPHIGHO2_02_FULL_42_16]OGY66253.1 MAG: hypothetical protein A3I89_03240 [Candidatus Harrisonbacteria bacterium RIFCSPLOWO2_02_FULL_41_11]
MVKNTITIRIIVAILTLILLVPFSASAATKPGSLFYFFDTAFERVNLFFTFNPEKKAMKALDYADKRLAEIKTITEEGGNADDIKTSIANYERNIALAAEKSKEIKDKGQEENLLNLITNSASKNQEVLSAVLAKVPDEAKGAITKAIEASKKGQVEALKQVAELNKEIVGLKQEIAELKRLQIGNKQAETELKKTVASLQKNPKILNSKEIIAKVKPAVVYIETSKGSGSGMIIESDGFILTNNHVVTGSYSVKVKLSDGRVFNGGVLGRNEIIDLAIIKIDGNNLPTVGLGNSDAIDQGDEAFTLGYPLGIEGDVSFKEGTVSRRIAVGNIDYLEISADILPGNSGGPLVDQFGQVIGINTAVLPEASVQGISLGETLKFAIPVNIAKTLIPDLKAGKVVIDEIVQAKEAATKAKEVEEKRKIEEVKMEAERLAAEKTRIIEEENRRTEAQILAAQQCRQNKQAIVTEYNNRKFNLEQQITDRRSKYYADYSAITNVPFVVAEIKQRQYDALEREANRDIALLELDLDNLYIDYSSRLNQFQCY